MADHVFYATIAIGHSQSMRLALGSLDTFASRPSWVADSRVSPNRTAAAAYCHRSVGLGFATIDGMIWKATLKEQSYNELAASYRHCHDHCEEQSCSAQWKPEPMRMKAADNVRAVMHQTVLPLGFVPAAYSDSGCSGGAAERSRPYLGPPLGSSSSESGS